MKKIILLASFAILSSCISTKNTIQNIDQTAAYPEIYENQFIIIEYATDMKYGYSQYYPVNVGFSVYENSNNKNVERFFNGLAGPNGEKLSYKLIETCCPFPSKNNKMGAGTLDLYEVSFEGISETKKIYIDTYERGKVMCPKGFTTKKIDRTTKK